MLLPGLIINSNTRSKDVAILENSKSRTLFSAVADPSLKIKSLCMHLFMFVSVSVSIIMHCWG